jgi:hypothetical protein
MGGQGQFTNCVDRDRLGSSLEFSHGMSDPSVNTVRRGGVEKYFGAVRGSRAGGQG